MISDSILSYSNPKSITAESFRALRTNLEFSMSQDDQRVVLITSSHLGEGKSTSAANLAVVYAMQGKKTLLIDADMRRGTQHKIFNLSNKNGLSNYLSNIEFSTDEFFKKTDVDNLWVVSCGVIPPNPAELLAATKFGDFIKDLRSIYDIIIIDGTPVLPVTDSVIIAPLVDKVVVVVSYGETYKDDLKVTKTTLESANAKIAGVILNKADNSAANYGKYGKYRRYGGSYSGYYSYEEDKLASKVDAEISDGNQEENTDDIKKVAEQVVNAKESIA